jgi:hypothetical protein
VLSHPPAPEAMLQRNGRSHLDGNYVIESNKDTNLHFAFAL